MLFWPFSFSYFGFNNAMISVFDVVLETAGLFLAVRVMYFNGDLRRLLSFEKSNVLMFFPLLAFVASMLFFAVDWSNSFDYVCLDVTGSHCDSVSSCGFDCFLFVSVFQGLRRLQ